MANGKCMPNGQKENEMTFDEMKALIVDTLGCEEDQVTPEASLTKDLEADSLDLVDLIMDVEDVFEIEVEDDDAKGISTVGDLVKYIEDKI